VNRQPYPNELYHYGVPGMRWGHRKARIEERKERQRKRGIDRPIGTAIGKGLITWGAITAAGLATVTVGAMLLKSKTMTLGKLKASAMIVSIGKLTMGSAALAGVIAGGVKLGKNLDNIKKQNNS